MRSKALPVGVDEMSCCSFSIDFCASSSSCCCIIVENSLSLIIMFSFFSRFCTSSSSSHCSTKASWASLEISVLSSDGLEMEISAYNSWGELIYNFFGTDLLRSIFVQFPAISFKTFSSLCCKMWQWLRHYLWQVNTFEISLCAIDLIDGAQCKVLRFPVNFSGDCQISSVGNCLPRTCRGIEGVVGEVKSVSWGGAQTKGEVHKRELTKTMFSHSDLLTSLTSSLTPLFFTIRKLALRTNEKKR